MSSSLFIPRTPVNPRKYAFLLPGITPRTLSQSEHLLEKNHTEHHIFFNESGFHNHLVHHYLAAYSLGADNKRLKEIYDDHASYQRKLPPSVGELTRENYKNELGNREAYTSYLRLFQKEIEKYGMVDSIRRWMFADDMLARTVGGAYHPLIHLGYAVEFDLPAVAAEGLAMAACTEANLSPLIPNLPSLQEILVPVQAASMASSARDMVSKVTNDVATKLGFGGSGSITSSGAQYQQRDKKDPESANSLTATDMTASLKEAMNNNAVVDLAEEIHRDTDFDGVVKFKDSNKIRAFLANPKGVEKLKVYASRWHVHDEDKDLQAKLKEMYTACMLIYGASAIREQGIKLDFFLMHALTSIHAVHLLMPHLAPNEFAALLRGHAATTLAYYISRGRPSLQVDLLLKYESDEATNNSANPWLKICERAINAPEAHIIKVIRACAVGQVVYGHDRRSEPFEKAWVRLADMTLKIAGNKVDDDSYWNHKGIGFDEAWQ
ncbi:hypothetical protein BDB00DRAFT_776255 [Zychaea mexicana]|uniref:uncharacterized protein n=1 Tax=Zychaea mexicana TaxID=64656 RepID=UPI0022FE1620|nr:uncharacterized protein BDB00DRAFT_776255 [Zychaea mexicana]KAI9474864.1 hypothetical protein BDB00DRAFT_776255 [Zychaea mexicana]